MDKYIATVETNQGDEVICYLKPKQTVGTLEEVEKFVEDSLVNFYWSKYRIYKLEQVGESIVQIKMR